MPHWNLHSNVADVLSLGPRTAGRLMQVGVRTVADLLAAEPQGVARRLSDARLSGEVIEAWQQEARLVLAVPELPLGAAPALVAIGYCQPEKIARSAPTELLSAFERIASSNASATLLGENFRPSVSELAIWIHCAQQSIADQAA